MSEDRGAFDYDRLGQFVRTNSESILAVKLPEGTSRPWNDVATGVVDGRSRLYGYHDFLVCDGSTVPASPGVNPSLTITAMTEHAMNHVPARPSAVN